MAYRYRGFEGSIGWRGRWPLFARSILRGLSEISLGSL